MGSEFLNKKLIQVLTHEAASSYKNRAHDVSYDKVTQKVMSAISWSEPLNLGETTKFLFIKTRYVEKLLYYYGQIIKEVSASGAIDLNQNEYLNFWSLLEKLEIEQYFTQYKISSLDSKNLFPFLSLLKGKINEELYLNNFKLKSIEMIEFKKELSNEAK